MSRNYKLYFKYLYFTLPHLYISQVKKGSQNLSLVLFKDLLYFTSLHIRFSSIFYSTQLVDIFSYELPNNLNLSKSEQSTSSDSYLVYNFHNVLFQDRIFLFCVDSSHLTNHSSLNSIAEIFPNANWLEREASELTGVAFNNKKDLRNLMLQYGDTSVPFQKSIPSIGFKELYYDSVNDVLLETPVSIQI